MMSKYTVTYSNMNKECSMSGVIKVRIFADTKQEALQSCDDIYNNMNGFFRVISCELLGKGVL